METKISKILFRQDTQANWTNSNTIPGLGEPCFDIDNKIFKIGDGEHTFNQLPSQTLPSNITFIEEPLANSKKYSRVREEGQTIGKWVEIIEPDQRKTIADLLSCNYDTELDMNYTIKTLDGEEEVYGIRYHLVINAEINELVESVIKTEVNKLIYFNAMISSDNHHDYAIPVNTDKFSANVRLDEENGSIVVTSKSDEVRTQAPLDIYMLYTKR